MGLFDVYNPFAVQTDSTNPFNSSSQFDLSSSFNPAESYLQSVSDSYNSFAQPIVNTTNFQTGLSFLNSDNYTTRLKGRQLINDSIPSTSTINPTPPKTKANIGKIGQQIGSIADTLGSFMPQKSEYNGPKGNITQSLDTLYDQAANYVSTLGPVGGLVGGIMKGANVIGKGLDAIGGGTDSMTTTDAILGSSFLNLTPLGLINGFGGKKADTITKDNEAFAQVGSSYTGTDSYINDALQKSGKKYGLFSSGARRRANRQIADAKQKQSIISDIADEATDRFNIRDSMASINGNNYEFQLQGGYNQSNVRVGRNGMLLQRARDILKAQKGNKLTDPFQIYLQNLPENQKDSTQYRVKDYWEFNGKPRDFEEAKKRGMFKLQKDGWHANSVAENPFTGEIEYMKPENHKTRFMESDWYEKGLIYNDDGTITQLAPGVPGYDDWKDFTSNYELVKTQPYWKYVKRKSPIKQNIIQHKNGGSIIELTSETTINLVNPLDIPEFQNGGSINVIPDGALHARKHNMDLEGITKKGIPVISKDENGSIEQHAEIEKEELILRLEVTQKLEELEKKYYSEESSQKEKDEYALEAGKLITEELLHNTKDNAGLL